MINNCIGLFHTYFGFEYSFNVASDLRNVMTLAGSSGFLNRMYSQLASHDFAAKLQKK